MALLGAAENKYSLIQQTALNYDNLISQRKFYPFQPSGTRPMAKGYTSKKAVMQSLI